MNLKEKIDNLPKTPGIYMMKDKYGDVIYVGKSKKLKERVKSYFVNSKNHSRKVKRLVKNIEDLDVILTDTELDALILECEMIKKIRPMYNQLLKNHENYSYIKINKNIKYPYIEVSKEIEDDSLYFGPYTMDKKLDEIVSIISREYKTRTCKIMNKCIKYDLNKCIGPCREIVSKEDYNIIIDTIIKDLNNSNKNLINILNKNIEFLKTTSKALIVIPLILMLPIVVNFEGSFVLFHKIMFNNDYWIFDPNLDPVINILPEEFFFHAGLMILILIIIASLTNYLIYRFLKREQ